jgi:hypothetical protein
VSDTDFLDPDVEVWTPTDTWLAGLIRRLRGLSPGEPLPPGLLESWRRHVQREVRRHAVARARGRAAGPMPSYGRGRTPDPAADLILELLATPAGQFYIGVAAGLASLLAAVAAAAAVEMQVQAWNARRERDQKARADAAELVRYIDWKSGGALYREDWRGPLWARHKAACNAVTPRRAIAWRVRLADNRLPLPTVRNLLAEIAEVGRVVIDVTAPLRIWDMDGGPPRGLVPDPPEPEEEDDMGRKGGRGTPLKPEPGRGR